MNKVLALIAVVLFGWLAAAHDAHALDSNRQDFLNRAATLEAHYARIMVIVDECTGPLRRGIAENRFRATHAKLVAFENSVRSGGSVKVTDFRNAATLKDADRKLLMGLFLKQEDIRPEDAARCRRDGPEAWGMIQGDKSQTDAMLGDVQRMSGAVTVAEQSLEPEPVAEGAMASGL